MQQNLKFPAQCTVIPAEELEQVSGGAPAWVGAVKPLLSYGVELGKAFVQIVGAAYTIYVYGKIIKNSMEGIKDTMNWFINLN